MQATQEGQITVWGFRASHISKKFLAPFFSSLAGQQENVYIKQRMI
jgi:hypothetical protein